MQEEMAGGEAIAGARCWKVLVDAGYWEDQDSQEVGKMQLLRGGEVVDERRILILLMC